MTRAGFEFSQDAELNQMLCGGMKCRDRQMKMLTGFFHGTHRMLLKEMVQLKRGGSRTTKRFDASTILFKNSEQPVGGFKSLIAGDCHPLEEKF